MTEVEQNDWPCGTKICMFYENQNICFRKKKFFGFLAIQFQVRAPTITAHVAEKNVRYLRVDFGESSLSGCKYFF